MIVRLDEEMVEFVTQLIASGRYSNEDAVVATALRQMRDKGAKMAEIRRIMLEENSQDPIHLMG